MNPNIENLNDPAERRKSVRLKVRPDLQTYNQKYEGKTFHVIKDPVCLRYYRFNKQEHFVFGLFDGEHTLEQVRDRFESEFPPQRLEYQDLEVFGRGGSIYMKNGSVELRKGRDTAAVEIAPLAPQDAEPITHMVNALRTKKPLGGIVGLDINVGVAEIIEAAKMSVKSGKAVALPLPLK